MVRGGVVVAGLEGPRPAAVDQVDLSLDLLKEDVEGRIHVGRVFVSRRHLSTSASAAEPFILHIYLYNLAAHIASDNRHSAIVDEDSIIELVMTWMERADEGEDDQLLGAPSTSEASARLVVIGCSVPVWLTMALR